MFSQSSHSYTDHSPFPFSNLSLLDSEDDVERLFSLGRHLLEQKRRRGRLSGDTTQQLLLLRSNGADLELNDFAHAAPVGAKGAKSRPETEAEPLLSDAEESVGDEGNEVSDGEEDEMVLEF